MIDIDRDKIVEVLKPYLQFTDREGVTWGKNDAGIQAIADEIIKAIGGK